MANTMRGMVIALAVVGVSMLCTSCGGSSGGGASVFNVSMTATDTFDPQVIEVTPGSIVRWTNADVDVHSAVVDPANAAPDGPDSDVEFPAGVPSGSSYDWNVPTNAASGTVWYYHCHFHGAAGDGTSIGTGMAGAIMIP